MSSFQTLYNSLSPDSHLRGKQFEHICKWFLETDPHYSSRLQKVWLWEDWPGRWGADCGIDLIAEDSDGKTWAIQAKCYDPNYSVTKHDIDKFLSESVNEAIDFRLLIATTDLLGGNARKVILRQNEVIPISMVLLNDLEKAALVWPSDADKLDSGGKAGKATPRQHQLEAIEATVSGLVDRGQIIMACGTGKTLTALWVAEKLESKRTLVLLPSLLLLSKTLADWVEHGNNPFAYLPVCSDDTVTRNADAVMSSTSDLAYPSTTNAGEIAGFLRKRGTRVVFSTYQSSPKIAEAFKQGGVPEFDLVIADEAHRCAGKVASAYGAVLDNNAIPAKKRLFMTATPRVYTPHLRKTAADSGYDVASMDDEAVFGPVLHRLTFGEAIEKNLLSDYQVVVMGIDDATYKQMVDERRIIETDTGLTSDARSLANHVGLAKSMGKYNLQRVITFHSRVAWASRFASDLSEVLEWMPEEYRPSGDVLCSYVSGEMPSSMRNQRLALLADVEVGQRAVLANARCLSEGVDVPALDGVAFMDPRKSEIDIVQAVGRAIRLSDNKLKGTIIVPVFITDDDDPDVVLGGSEFDKVWKVVNALRAHDEALGEELDSLRTQLGNRGSSGRPAKIIFDIPTKIDKQFASAFDTRLVEATTASWHFWFGLLQSFTKHEGHARVPHGYKTIDGYSLGAWVLTQRQSKEKIGEKQRARLEAMPGWVWDIFEWQWDSGFEHLKEFATKKGHSSPAKGYKTTEGYPLGQWVNSNRTRKNRLSLDRLKRLESLPGWIWEARDEKWETNYDHVKLFFEQEGHIKIPQSYKVKNGPALGYWVTTQRRKKETLTTEKIEKLEALPGWVWDLYEEQWKEAYQRLQEFVESEGHSQVPFSLKTSDGFSLGGWVGSQRTRKDELSDFQIEQLESMPQWSWGVASDKWDTAFSLIEGFAKTHGHARVPPNFKAENGFALGRWVRTQRYAKEKLSTDRAIMLASMPEWSWTSDEIDRKWEVCFTNLESFTEQFGHSRPARDFKTVDGFALGSWVSKQRGRRKKLSGEKVFRLESLSGWVWDVIGAKWEEGIEHMSTFVESKGHARVPRDFITNEGYRLGNWVSNKRVTKSQLTEDRIIKLEAFPGWSWDARDAKWEDGFEQLISFVSREGHSKVDSNYITTDGFKLGAWFSSQRSQKVRGLLSSARICRLEELPSWVWKAR